MAAPLNLQEGWQALQKKWLIFVIISKLEKQL